MFEVGKRYVIRMIVHGDEFLMSRTVESYDHPLVKFADIVMPQHFLPVGAMATTIRREILNVTSPNFISAVLQDEENAWPASTAADSLADDDLERRL